MIIKSKIMKRFPVIILLCLTCTAYSQKFLNLDFESGTPKPLLWFTGGEGYTVVLDDQEKASLSKSLKMSRTDDPGKNFGVCTGSFPVELAKGREIEFMGKIKTLGVKDGYAGLWWRVDGKDGKTVGFDNMAGRGLRGTNDWKEVSIKMKVDESAANINFGALFSGKGIAWFDGFRIKIDGKDFTDLKPRTTGLTKDETTWLKEHIYPLDTFDPAIRNNQDLSILKKLIGNASVVALGETSHGSSEIFKMKHRIIRYLAENADFDIFSIEANMPESYRISNYTIEGKGDPTDLIKGMYFWTWRTQEVLDMTEWMKQHNKSNDKIAFTGFDLQFFQGAIKELDDAFVKQPTVLNSINVLNTVLNTINSERKKTPRAAVSDENKDNASIELNTIRKNIQGLRITDSEKKWLLQNIRVIEQYIDLNKTFQSRDRYMAENLMWIKNQNPQSKIVIWAHNGHIQRTGNSMGRFLSDSLKNDYLTIGFTFHKGSYTAVGSKGLSSYPAQESYSGTYENMLNSINEPIFILDLREVKKLNSPNVKWLQEEMPFRSVGAMNTENEFYETSLTDNFDLLIFINESTSSTLLN